MIVGFLIIQFLLLFIGVIAESLSVQETWDSPTIVIDSSTPALVLSGLAEYDSVCWVFRH